MTSEPDINTTATLASDKFDRNLALGGASSQGGFGGAAFGGAISTGNTTVLTATHSTLSNNLAQSINNAAIGGALDIEGGTALFTRVVVVGNRAAGSVDGASGGGLSNVRGGALRLTGCTVMNNSSVGGSGLGASGSTPASPGADRLRRRPVELQLDRDGGQHCLLGQPRQRRRRGRRHPRRRRHRRGHRERGLPGHPDQRDPDQQPRHGGPRERQGDRGGNGRGGGVYADSQTVLSFDTSRVTGNWARGAPPAASARGAACTSTSAA